MTQETIVTKVHKLLRLAGNNTNADEAALAASKAQELIDRYNLSNAVLALDETQAQPDEPIYDFYTAGSPLDSQKTQQTWRQRLAVTLAKLNSCRIYVVGGDTALVGRPSDADSVRYLYGYLTHEVNRLTEEHGRGMGTSWRNNFRLGVVDTVNRKLNESHRAFATQARSEVTGMALVKVDKALAVIEKRGTEVDSWIKQNLKLHKVSSQQVNYNASARARGREAGKSISINSAKGALGSGQRRLT